MCLFAGCGVGCQQSLIEAFQRQVAVFAEARRLAPGRRAAYLDKTCAGDAALRQCVDELLQATERGRGLSCE